MSIRMLFEMLITITLILLLVCVIISVKNKSAIAKQVRRLLIVTMLTLLSYRIFIITGKEFYGIVFLSLFSLFIDWLLIAFMDFTHEYTDSGFANRPLNIVMYVLAVADTISFVLNVRFKHAFHVVQVAYPRWGIRSMVMTNTTIYYDAHLILSYVLSAYILGMLLHKIFVSPKFYRKKYYYILVCFLLLLALDGISLLIHLPFNLSIFAYGISAIMITFLSLSFIPRSLVHNMLTLVVKDLPDMVICFDQNGKVIFSNDSTNEYMAETMRADYVAQKYRDWRLSYAASEESRVEWTEDVMVKGKMRHFAVTTQKLFDDNGHYLGVYFITSDRTDEVDSYEKQIEESITVASQKSQFWANIAHEMRTPMNTILGLNELILRETTEPEIKGYASDVRMALDSMIGLVNDILDFSKIDSKKMTILPAEYEVLHLIKSVETLIRPKVNEKNLVLNLEIDEFLPRKLLGDELRIQQVIMNLLTNAVKYTEKGSITVRVFGERRFDEFFLHVEVEDTGIGIRKQNIPLLFQAYERLDEARVHGIQGTGLGINICSQLLEQMGGNLEIESEYGKGSRFSFAINQSIMDGAFIPKYEEYTIVNPELIPEKESPKEKIAEGIRILLVDDNSMNRVVFKALLKKAGILVTEAEDGEKAIKLCREQVFDLIFLDHLMPGMCGDEVLRVMKSDVDNMNREIPVIMLTANDVTDGGEFYRNAGFDDFLAKPIEPALLEQIIARWTEKSK